MGSRARIDMLRIVVSARSDPRRPAGGFWLPRALEPLGADLRPGRYAKAGRTDDAPQAIGHQDWHVRAALVTGAAGGIGRAVTERLAAEGVGVLAVDLAADPTVPGEPFAADLTTREGNRASVEAAIERFGRLDVVVANAGFQHVAPVADFSEDSWDALLALMLTSPFLLAKYAWQQLRATGAGRFVAVASAHGVVASPYKAGYVAAKHGVVGLVKTLALEGAADGITANAVCPGYVRTPLVERQIAAQAQANGITEERVLEEVILAPHAIKRLIEPSEVADVIAFLAGPAGATITGVPVLMDAGWTAH
ncbi:MAG: short-chain dehydrogenase/reductase [Actinomycetia bacterium]|nr:short-chain dehydrogenase/reductase [Actinomycetes bacterium]